MINGAHAIIYSADADADRAFLRDVIGLPGIDAGAGWLIFGLPPAEIAVHPSATGGSHEIYFMCADIEQFVSQARRRGVSLSDVANRDWGRLTRVSLPGGGQIGVYEPRHERPKNLQSTAETGSE